MIGRVPRLGRVTHWYLGVTAVLSVGVVVPDTHVPAPLGWLLVGMGIAALAGALPSLLVIGAPVYFIGNVASGDVFFLSGSMPLFVVSFVLSVLANAVLVELVARRRVQVAAPRGTAGIAAD